MDIGNRADDRVVVVAAVVVVVEDTGDIPGGVASVALAHSADIADIEACPEEAAEGHGCWPEVAAEVAVEGASVEVAGHEAEVVVLLADAVAAGLQSAEVAFAASAALAAVELVEAAEFVGLEGAAGVVEELTAAAAFEEASETFAVAAGLASVG